jgi:hypothetical protein
MSTYVIFDGDNDGWAYQYIRGWAANRRLGFDFKDSHDLDNMGPNAQNEQYVKQHLRTRMQGSTLALVLVGASTKNLYRYVRWEIEIAMEYGVPIVVVNLNKHRGVDNVRLPPILRNFCALHIGYRYRAIKYAIQEWPGILTLLTSQGQAVGPRFLTPQTYDALGLGLSEAGP